jgi:hypothetical protein
VAHQDPSILREPQPQTRITRRAAVFFSILLYVIVAFVLAVVLGHVNIPVYWRMLNDGRAVHATVLRTACDNHGSVFYRFEVADREYTGVGNAGFGTPECGQLKPGDQIVVYYLPSDPNVTRPGEIRERWDNELIFLFLAVTILPAVIGSSFWRSLRAGKRVSPKPRRLRGGPS